MFDEDREAAPDETPPEGADEGLAGSESEEEQKAEKRVSDTQRAFHEKAREVAELQEKLARLEGRMDERGREPERKEPDDPFPEYSDPEWAEKIIAEPKVLVDTLKKRDAMFASKFNEAMKWADQRIQTLEGQLKDVAPERAPIRQKIAELAEADPEFAKAPREAQEFIAKRELAGGTRRETPEYPGSVGGTARVASGGGGDPAFEREVKRWRTKMGGIDNG